MSPHRSFALGMETPKNPFMAAEPLLEAAAIIAVGVNSDGRREVLGMDIGPSEAETFWTTFLRKLTRRCLGGIKLVISDAHEASRLLCRSAEHELAALQGRR